MTIHGVDVSSHQPGWKPDPKDEFVFVKATEGRTYVNDEMTGQTSRARARGLVVGFYHFLLPGNAKAQAAHFVEQANFKRGDLLVCDWENTAKGHPSVQDAATFIAETKRLVPECRVGLYCNKSAWLTTTVKAGDFLWLAAYMKSHGVKSPLLKFWQYKDHPIDQNTGYFASRAKLAAWALGTPETSPKGVGRAVVPAVGIGDVTNAGTKIPDPTGDERSVSFRGGRTCVCVAFSLPLVEREMIRRGLIKRSIDIWQFGYRNDVKASAGYHAKGGNTDVDQFSDEQLRCWRECGWAMQRRDVGFATKHGHGWPVGCPHLAKPDQVRSWLNGRNGLRGGGKISGPGPVGKDTPSWRKAAARLLG
jgi:hypothetical protein